MYIFIYTYLYVHTSEYECEYMSHTQKRCRSVRLMLQSESLCGLSICKTGTRKLARKRDLVNVAHRVIAVQKLLQVLERVEALFAFYIRCIVHRPSEQCTRRCNTHSTAYVRTKLYIRSLPKLLTSSVATRVHTRQRRSASTNPCRPRQSRFFHRAKPLMAERHRLPNMTRKR